ncbi:MAG: hypothetical protein JWM93_3448 [Frankiales bacterium]|nr:hypothetical protein [Frankiales bacterium]
MSRARIAADVEAARGVPGVECAYDGPAGALTLVAGSPDALHQALALATRSTTSHVGHMETPGPASVGYLFGPDGMTISALQAQTGCSSATRLPGGSTWEIQAPTADSVVAFVAAVADRVPGTSLTSLLVVGPTLTDAGTGEHLTYDGRHSAAGAAAAAAVVAAQPTAETSFMGHMAVPSPTKGATAEPADARTMLVRSVAAIAVAAMAFLAVGEVFTDVPLVSSSSPLVRAQAALQAHYDNPDGEGVSVVPSPTHKKSSSKPAVGTTLPLTDAGQAVQDPNTPDANTPDPNTPDPNTPDPNTPDPSRTNRPTPTPTRTPTSATPTPTLLPTPTLSPTFERPRKPHPSTTPTFTLPLLSPTPTSSSASPTESATSSPSPTETKDGKGGGHGSGKHSTDGSLLDGLADNPFITVG